MRGRGRGAGAAGEERVCHSPGCPSIALLYCSIWSIEVHPTTLLTHPSRPLALSFSLLLQSHFWACYSAGHHLRLPQEPLGDFSAVHAPLWAKGTLCSLGSHLLRWPYSHYYLGVLPAPQISLEMVMLGFLLLITGEGANDRAHTPHWRPNPRAVPLGLFCPQGLERFFFSP